MSSYIQRTRCNVIEALLDHTTSPSHCDYKRAPCAIREPSLSNLQSHQPLTRNYLRNILSSGLNIENIVAGRSGYCASDAARPCLFEQSSAFQPGVADFAMRRSYHNYHHSLQSHSARTYPYQDHLALPRSHILAMTDTLLVDSLARVILCIKWLAGHTVL